MPTQQPPKNLKKLLIALAIVIVAAVAFSIIRGQSSSKPQQASSRPGLVTSQIATTSTGESTTSASTLANDPTIRRSQELAVLLKSVSHIHLDTDIFKNPSLSGLVDISSPLPADPAPGRPNPFLPIGADGGMSLDGAVIPGTGIDPITQFLGGVPN